MLWLFSCRLEAAARGRWHRAGLLRRRGDYYLGCGRRRYCGRVCLSEPEASSGPAAMLLAVSRSPSSIPRRSPCPERCLLPLASLNHIHLSKPQKHPRLHPLPERCLLPLASLNHIHLSKPQNHPRLHPSPERYHLPLASLDHIHTHPKKARHLHIPKTPDSHQSYISWK